MITKSNFGGAQRYVYELAVAMASSFDVVVACGGRGLLVEKLEAQGIVTIEINNFQRNIHPLKELKALRELFVLFKTQRPDIVHLNSSKAGLSGALIARFCRVPTIVFTIHGWAFLEPRNILWKIGTWIGSFVTLLLVDKAIPITQYDASHAYMPLTQSKYTPVIYNAVTDVSLLEKEQARKALTKNAEFHADDLWLVTTAELHPKKNIATAIQAAAQYNKAHKQKIFYVVIGDGILRETLTQEIERLEAQSSIELVGFKDDARVYLQAADIFLVSSKQEGLPYALLEAGKAGLPTIASTICGIPEVIKNEKNGLLIDPNRVATIVLALETLAENPELRAQYGRALQQTIEDNHALQIMAEKTKRVYTGT